MRPQRTLTARAAAWKTLNQCNIFRHDTSEILSRLLPYTDRPAQATDIVLGVIRNRGMIDRVLKMCSELNPSRVKPSQWNLLRIGAYELVYAPKTTDYAIINEAAELARQFGSKKGAGFINAVLRNVQRKIERRQSSPEDKHLCRMAPQTPVSACLFNIDLLPDSEKQPASYLSTAFSIPQALIEEWLKAYGFKQSRDICFASNRHPSILLQPNILRTTTEDLSERLQKEGVSNECLNNMVRIHRTGKINTSRSYLEGLFFVQDVTAWNAIKTLSPRPDWTVLDMCAAPGGKCMASALWMQDKGIILASDADSKRLSRVRENAKRMRFHSIETIPEPKLERQVCKLKRLDVIILDVPCSNTGVLARRVEARWRWNPKAVESLRGVQQKLLQKAASLSRPQTKILYSTCSIQPPENTEQVQWFLSQNTSFALMSETLSLPTLSTPKTFDHDGGYAAILQAK
jgi:16S rRNA (cytosine967-C5)-methyltransferase